LATKARPPTLKTPSASGDAARTRAVSAGKPAAAAWAAAWAADAADDEDADRPPSERRARARMAKRRAGALIHRRVRVMRMVMGLVSSLLFSSLIDLIRCSP
jgi:hypothetical protein